MPDADLNENDPNPVPSGFQPIPDPLAESNFQDAFPQGCQFSPDRLCILTSHKNDLLLYNTEFKGCSPGESWKPVLKCASGDAIRSYTWYPHMNSSVPSTCCFLAASRDQPAHLYDAYSGAIRASYRPYNALDEMESPSTTCFANNGQQIVLGGFRTDRMLQVFDISRPGREPTVVLKLGKTKRSKDGQKGLVSALTASNENLLAVGTYSPGSIYLYDLRAQSTPVSQIVVTGTCVAGHGKSHSRKRKHFAVAEDNGGENEEDALNFSAARVQWFHSRARTGVIQLEFDESSQSLFSASRRSNVVLQWDLRRISSSSFCPGIASFETRNDTNQRLEFELNGDKLWIGGDDRRVRIYDYKQLKPSTVVLDGFQDVVNGVSVASLPEGRTLLCTATGTRQFPSMGDWETDDPHASSDLDSGGTLALRDMKSAEL